jgi:adenylylsulfate kinase-like enzyme
VTDELVPVLWLTGPAGVGKSAVSWQIFTELAQAGIHAAFADTDQLCMCYPALASSEVTRARDGDGDAADGVAGNILLICGPTGVGKSTIGFELYLRYLRAGRTAGYVDLEQIGFLRPDTANDPGHHQLKARNLAAIWRTYHAAGARPLVATGPIPTAVVRQTYLYALPAAAVTVCRLHAEAPELRTRIMSRGSGGSWPQPGDPLRGQSADYLSGVADQAAASAQALSAHRSKTSASTPAGER